MAVYVGIDAYMMSTKADVHVNWFIDNYPRVSDSGLQYC